MKNVPELFGSMVFNDVVMRERLPEETYKSLHKTIDEGKDLNIDVAEIVAGAMKDWAIEKGATHFTHWFQPMTGITAEKHDSFISPQADGTIIMEFSGKELIKGESDASSFPSGGLRATFEARGYTAWDPTSPAFIKDDALCIPTIFCSFGGEVLDKKTPLLKSMETFSNEAVRVMHALGHTDVAKVTPTVGPEQEYFLIDKNLYAKRRDLILTGRTLFGAKPPKGQELDDHYYGAIKPKVMAYMQELNQELWSLGINAKTEHNEAAPSQHEMAPVYSTANIATDHNQLTMEIMKKVADRHGLACLLHEKPFKGVNGSGKHNNWSVSTNNGINLLKPGKNPSKNNEFLAFFCAVVNAVDKHQDLIRASISTAGNDHRLGGDEAPPAIVSIYIGDELENMLRTIAKGEEFENTRAGKMQMGLHVIPDFKKDTTDRNRTSPLAFTSNKFEFRMPGSSDSIADANTVLNTIVADELRIIGDKLESANGDTENIIREIVRDTIENHDRIIFNGNNYSEEWVREAENRGLKNYESTVDALPCYKTEENIALFERNNIFTREEITSRSDLMLENYCKLVNIEALTTLDMAVKDILPAVNKYADDLTKTLTRKKELGMSLEKDAECILLGTITNLANVLFEKAGILENAAEESATPEEYRDKVIPAMNEVRKIVDSLEEIVGRKYWPLPDYVELLYAL